MSKSLAAVLALALFLSGAGAGAAEPRMLACRKRLF